jgi:hypothetical protein
MLKIKLVSDLHLEFADIDIDNSERCDVLILGGDILIADDFTRGSASPRAEYAALYRAFIARCAASFKHVVAIAGNHEFYGGKWNGSLDTLRAEYGAHSNVHFLEDSTCVLDGVRFIGATLWTDLNRGDPVTMHVAGITMNDYRQIKNDGPIYRRLCTDDTVMRHRTSLEYIRGVLDENPGQPTVVVGHHLPTHMSVDHQYRNSRDALLNYAYYSALENTMLDNTQIVLWTCGHTHHRHRYYVGTTLVAAAPRGYKGHEPQADNFVAGIVDLGNLPSATEVDMDYRWILQ